MKSVIPELTAEQMISLLVFITVIATEQNLYIFLTPNYVTDDTNGLCTKINLMVSDGVKLMNSAICWLLYLSKTISCQMVF